jgi:hypothetical protein
LFNPLRKFNSTLPPETGDEAIITIFELVRRYLAATSWDEVLALHVPDSAKRIEARGMKANWEYAHSHPQPWLLSVGALITLGNTETGIYCTQALSCDTSAVIYDSMTPFYVSFYRWRAGNLYFDSTLEDSDLYELLSNTPRNEIEATLMSWYDRRVLYSSPCDLIRYAEQALVNAGCKS